MLQFNLKIHQSNLELSNLVLKIIFKRIEVDPLVSLFTNQLLYFSIDFLLLFLVLFNKDNRLLLSISLSFSHLIHTEFFLNFLLVMSNFNVSLELGYYLIKLWFIIGKDIWVSEE